MSKQRLVNTKFWTDNFVLEELDPLEKLVYIYLLTNPYTEICGVYELPLRIMAVETGIDKDNLKNAIIPRLEKYGKILYKDGWVAIKNFIKHQVVNPSVSKGIQDGLERAPEELRQFVTAYVQPMDSLSQPVTASHSLSQDSGNLIKSNLNKDTRESGQLGENDKSFRTTYKKAIDVFYRTVEEKHNFKVEFNQSDGSLLKKTLKKYDFDFVKGLLEWYPYQPKFKEHPTLTSALSTHSVNLYKIELEKAAWQSK